MRVVGRLGVVFFVLLAMLVFAAAAGAARYVVVLKPSQTASGVKAIRSAGGTVVSVDKLGIATVRSSRPSFARTLRATGAVSAVGPDAALRQPTARKTVSAAPPGTNPASAEALTCAALYSVSALIGPDPLGLPVGHEGDQRDAERLVRRQPGARRAGRRHRHRGRPHASATSCRTSTSPRRARSSTRRRRPRTRRSRSRAATARTRRRSRTTRATGRTPPERSPRRSTASGSQALRRRRRSSRSRPGRSRVLLHRLRGRRAHLRR